MEFVNQQAVILWIGYGLYMFLLWWYRNYFNEKVIKIKISIICTQNAWVVCIMYIIYIHKDKSTDVLCTWFTSFYEFQITYNSNVLVSGIRFILCMSSRTIQFIKRFFIY